MAVHLNQRYELGDVIGSGGMGAVHRATDTRLGRTVAVKVLRSDQGGDEVARARMRSEANLAASIHHPGVAQVFDFEEDDASAAGSSYIVMQYVEGRSLSELLKERGAMPPDQVMSVVQQVAEGLQAAHDAGIVHRDLKPANIMLTPAGRTVLVDFGIAQAATSEPLTDTGSLVGTTDYISPEQVRGRSATPQSDLYSLGVVAFHCLTGTSPFRRDTHIATAMAHLHDELPPFAVDVPDAVQGLIVAMTSKDPADRPGTAADVARAAAAIGAAGAIDLPGTFEMPRPTPRPAVAERATTVTSVPAPPAPRRRRPVTAYAAVATLLALLAFLGVRELMLGGPPVVPDVVGMSVDLAAAEIREAGFTPRPKMVDVANRTKGDVIEQSPAAGSEAAEDDPIELSVVSGKVRVSAGSVIGTPYFVVQRQDVTRSGDTGDVVALDMSGRLPDGATITLSVAVAPLAPVSSGGTSGTGSGSSGTGSGSSQSTGGGAKSKDTGNTGNGDNGKKGKGKNKGKTKSKNKGKAKSKDKG
jgi:predicted Ser/Thr protein kinase